MKKIVLLIVCAFMLLCNVDAHADETTSEEFFDLYVQITLADLLLCSPTGKLEDIESDIMTMQKMFEGKSEQSPANKYAAMAFKKHAQRAIQEVRETQGLTIKQTKTQLTSNNCDKIKELKAHLSK